MGRVLLSRPKMALKTKFTVGATLVATNMRLFWRANFQVSRRTSVVQEHDHPDFSARQEPRPPVNRKTFVLEGEHLCEPKIFCRHTDLTICRPADLPKSRLNRSLALQLTDPTDVKIGASEDAPYK